VGLTAQSGGGWHIEVVECLSKCPCPGTDKWWEDDITEHTIWGGFLQMSDIMFVPM